MFVIFLNVWVKYLIEKGRRILKMSKLGCFGHNSCFGFDRDLWFSRWHHIINRISIFPFCFKCWVKYLIEKGCRGFCKMSKSYFVFVTPVLDLMEACGFHKDIILFFLFFLFLHFSKKVKYLTEDGPGGSKNV